VKKYVVRKRGSDIYVDRWQKLRQDVVQALAFPSIEDADFHRGQIETPTNQYEVCELTADDQIIPVQLPRPN